MKIKLTSVYVDDQEKALRFYTEVLGFTKKADFSNGPYRWLTVTSAEDPDGTELQLALDDNPAAKAYQQAMFQQGQPAVMFFTDDVKGDYERIKAQRRRVHHAADRGDRLDHRQAERHLRQPRSDHPAGALVGRAVIESHMPNAHDVLFRTLADPTRRAIFERLCRDGEQTVGALTAQSGVSQPAVSKHLGVLRQAGLVRDRHEGRQTHYSAQLGALAPLMDWTSQMAGFWQSRFDDLEDLLKRMDQ